MLGFDRLLSNCELALFSEHAATAAEILLNVLFPLLFYLLLHVTASLSHSLVQQITHHSLG